MKQTVTFDYYYGMQADAYSFYRIPKVLFTNEYFKELSCEAKVLYGLMLDRMSLSVKNRWFDERDRVYIIFTVEEVMEYMNCSKTKAVKSIAELDTDKGIGLIEKKRLGFGKANVIYVKNFMLNEVISKKEEEIQEEETLEALENQQKSKKWTSRSLKNGLQEVQKMDFKKSKNYTSRSAKNGLLEVQKMDSNYTDINDTDSNYTNQSIYQEPDEIDRRSAYKEIIQENIDYDILCQNYRQNEIDEIVELMIDILCSNKDIMNINGEPIPIQLVKSQFMKLNYEHMEYVSECMKNNNGKIRNIRQYLLTVLYNAPKTINHYYQAEVNHDLWGG